MKLGELFLGVLTDVAYVYKLGELITNSLLGLV